MFLKIATILVVLGLLLNLCLSFLQQIIVTGRYFGSSTLLFIRILIVGEAVSLNLPLIIFFVAFFFNLNYLNTKKSV